MDPSSLIHESPFPVTSAPPPPYNLAEIWQFPITNGDVGESSSILDVQPASRRAYGRNLSFAELPTGNNRDISLEESTVTEHSGRSGGRKRKDSASEDESSKLVSTSGGIELNGCAGKRLKVGGTSDENGEMKAEVEANCDSVNRPTEHSLQLLEPPKQDYIHVRARRGQATDSHSLAERARREKISERMKILQDLVPGCNKVIGKALVLDEIINYIQSLQRQVEFLSMKLEAVNSGIIPNIEGFPTKDFGMQAFEATDMGFGMQPAREYGQTSQPEWLHMQIGGGSGGFERPT